MKNILLLIGSLFFYCLVFSQKYAQNRLIVKYKPSTNHQKNAKLSQVLTQLGHSKTSSLTKSKIQSKSRQKTNEILLYTFKNNIDIPAAIIKLKETGVFDYVEPDFIGHGAGQKINQNFSTNSASNDTYYNRQWGLKNDGSFALSTSKSGADVDMELAWNVTTGNSNMIIAVLDTGVNLTHPEFSGRIWTNASETANNSDSDTNGYKDDLNGWDFANNDNDPSDDHGHGTNVAGITLATGNNNNGYAGVDWKCKLMPLKILDNNSNGFYSWWISAINYAVNNGAKIINMSVGGSSFSQSMKDAVDNAHSQNVIITVSMMNFNNENLYYPAAYVNTIAVGATNPNDQRSNPFFWNSTSGSNYGNHIDVVAPGNYIYGLHYSNNTHFGSYWGGTSQAAPLVAGITSLMLDQNPNLTVEEVRTILRETAEDQVGLPSEDTNGWDKYYGAGRVNAFNALQKVLAIPKDESLLQLSMYPNPTTGRIHFSGVTTNYEYTIFDTLGKKITQGIIKENTILIQHLKPGIYTLKVKSEHGVATKKIIKN